MSASVGRAGMSATAAICVCVVNVSPSGRQPREVAQPSLLPTCGTGATLRPSGAELRIEGVADRVAEEVESEDDQEQRGTGAEDDPRRLAEIATPGVDHAAPGRGRRLDAESQEGQRGFREDREGYAEGRLDHDRRGG